MPAIPPGLLFQLNQDLLLLLLLLLPLLGARRSAWGGLPCYTLVLL